MEKVFFPILVTAKGVLRRVYVEPSSLAVTPFEREVAGAVSFNGIGVIGPASLDLPRSVVAARIAEVISKIEKVVSPSHEETLHFIPFG